MASVANQNALAKMYSLRGAHLPGYVRHFGTSTAPCRRLRPNPRSVLAVAALQKMRDDLRAVGCAVDRHDRAHMDLDRAFADIEALGDILVGGTLRQQSQNVALTLGEQLEPVYRQRNPLIAVILTGKA